MSSHAAQQRMYEFGHRQRVGRLKRAFDLDGEVLVCPRCDRDGWGNIMHQLSHSIDVPYSTSGPGMRIEFVCEAYHHWALTFTDHSGSQILTLDPSVCMGGECRCCWHMDGA